MRKKEGKKGFSAIFGQLILSPHYSPVAAANFDGWDMTVRTKKIFEYFMHWSIFTCDNNNSSLISRRRHYNIRKVTNKVAIDQNLDAREASAVKNPPFCLKGFLFSFSRSVPGKRVSFPRSGGRNFRLREHPALCFFAGKRLLLLLIFGWRSNGALKCHIPRWYDDAVFLRPRNFMFPVDVFLSFCP